MYLPSIVSRSVLNSRFIEWPGNEVGIVQGSGGQDS